MKLDLLLPRPFRFPGLLVLAAGLFLSAGPVAAQEDRPTARLSVSRSDDGVRVIVTHSAPVVYTVQDGRNRLRIRYPDPIEFDVPEGDFDDPILQRYTFRDERTLTLYMGSEYGRFDSFELRHPFRLVIDLHAKQRTGRRNRGRTPAPRNRGTILVVDPGHGGVEEGAIGRSGLKEKDVTLLLARDLKHELELRHRDISVVLTRDEDRIVGLDERTAVANHNQADLFLSIHLNAAPRSSASGAETYYLSTDATDGEARKLAALENQSAQENKSQKLPSGLDMVLWDLAQNKHLAASSALAQAMQRHLNRLTGTRNRGVRQAPFRVLMGATMPAILVEVGFISNPREESKLATSDYRLQVVSAMAAAVQEFLQDLDRVSDPVSRRGDGATTP